MEQKELLGKLRALNSAIEDYLDKLDMDEGEKKEPKKSKEEKED